MLGNNAEAEQHNAGKTAERLPVSGKKDKGTQPRLDTNGTRMEGRFGELEGERRKLQLMELHLGTSLNIGVWYTFPRCSRFEK